MIDHVNKSGIQVHCGADTLFRVFMITHDVISTLLTLNRSVSLTRAHVFLMLFQHFEKIPGNHARYVEKLQATKITEPRAI